MAACSPLSDGTNRLSFGHGSEIANSLKAFLLVQSAHIGVLSGVVYADLERSGNLAEQTMKDCELSNMSQSTAPCREYAHACTRPGEG